MGENPNDEIGTLGPKDFSGISTKEMKELARPKFNTTAKPAKGVPLVSKPGLNLPDPAELEKEKLFPVIMLKSYRPRVDTAYRPGVFETDGDGHAIGDPIYSDPPLVEEGQDGGMIHRLEEGQPAMLPITEARELIKKGIAIRNDELKVA
jgi:hypothetical protein